MIYKLLVNSPSGEQKIEQVYECGSYFDESLVIWDERSDGQLPEAITLGKMQRIDNQLNVLGDYLPGHLNAVLGVARASKIAELKGGYVAEVYSPIDHAGNTWGADPDSRTLLAQVLAVGSVPEGMYWRDHYQTPVAMTYTDLQALGRAILDRGLMADQNLMTKTVLANAAASIEGINAITW